jgi:Mrp family chromosome partitioning ATPase
MSRNFELLRAADWSQEFFQGLPAEARVAEVNRKRVKRRPPGNDRISRLVQRLFLDTRSSQIRSVLFTPSTKKVASTWTCAQTARVLAESIEGTVCAVDMNFQSPALHQHFPGTTKLSPSHGSLGSSSVRDSAEQIKGSNLWVVTAGQAAKRWQQRTNATAAESTLLQLKTEFDYVLVDAPPIAADSNAIAAARSVDGVVLVAELTAKGANSVFEAQQKLDRAHLPLLGVVLSRVESALPLVLDRLIR